MVKMDGTAVYKEIMNGVGYTQDRPEKGKAARIRSLHSSIGLDLAIAKAALNEGNVYNTIKHIERAQRTLEKVEELEKGVA